MAISTNSLMVLTPSGYLCPFHSELPLGAKIVNIESNQEHPMTSSPNNIDRPVVCIYERFVAPGSNIAVVNHSHITDVDGSQRLSRSRPDHMMFSVRSVSNVN